MPDTQPQDQPLQSSPDIGSMLPADDKSMAGLVSGMTGLYREKAATDKILSDEFDVSSERDREVREAAFNAEGVAANNTPKPWDADKEHKRFETNPIEGFGSAGGLFAMIASAFTRAPMENAINGMAGAITSIKEGNEAGYKHAFDSFKENVKLADHRFKMQHELYNDALSMSTTNAAVSSIKFHNAATKFGDSQMLMLAEAGMPDKIYEAMAARAQANEQAVKAADAIDLHTVQKAAVESIKKNPPQTGDPVADKLMLAAQVQQIYDGKGKYGSAEQEAVGRFMQANMHQGADVIADGLAEIHQKFSPKAPNYEAYQNAKQAYRDAHSGAEPPPEEDTKMLQAAGLNPRPTGAGSGAGATLTNDRTINKDAEEHKQQQKKEHPDWDETKLDADRDSYVKSRKIATTAPSGNRSDDLQGKIDQTDNIIHGSEKNLDFLRTFKGGAGLMGKIMRGEEIASNIVGAGTQTDRVAFRRRVHELQEMVPRIITDSNGRPLKAAQDKVDDFVAGLNAGDTGPNTIRAYEDLIAEMQKRQGDYRKRKAGSEGPAAGVTDKKPADADWLNAYPVKN